MQRLLCAIGAMLLIFTSPAFAKGAEPTVWTVTQRSGAAQVLRSGVQPVAIQANSALAPGDVVVTGATGRVMLTRGGDYIVVAPSSRLLLPKGEQPGGFTRLIQQVGTMLYKVRHTGVPHFAVEAPMLAAVVKGTSFTVIVDKDRSAVQVTDGIVEVTAAQGGMRRLVERGDTVFINRAKPADLVDVKSAPTEISGSKASVSGVQIAGTQEESLSSIAASTAGLIREVPQSTTSAAAAQTSSSELVRPVPVAQVRPATVVAATVATVTTTASVSPASVSTPAVSTPAVTTPAVTTPAVSTPAITTPAVTVGPVTVPAVTVPAVTVPAVSIPAVSVPAVTTPAVSLPAVAIPAVTTPAVAVPAVTVPAVTVPAVTVPAVTVPAVTVPAVTVPAVTVPAVTAPIAPIVRGLFGG